MKKFMIGLSRVIFVLLHIILWLAFVIPPMAESPDPSFWSNPFTLFFIILMVSMTVIKKISLKKLKGKGGRYRHMAHQTLFWLFLRSSITGLWISWIASEATKSAIELGTGLGVIALFALFWGYFVYLVQAKNLREQAQKNMITALHKMAEGMGGNIDENNPLLKVIKGEDRKEKESLIHSAVAIQGNTQAVALQRVDHNYNYRTTLEVDTSPAANYKQKRTDWYYCFAGSTKNPSAQKEKWTRLKKLSDMTLEKQKESAWRTFCQEEKVESLSIGKGFYVLRWKGKVSIKSMGYLPPTPEKLRTLAEKIHSILG